MAVWNFMPPLLYPIAKKQTAGDAEKFTEARGEKKKNCESLRLLCSLCVTV